MKRRELLGVGAIGFLGTGGITAVATGFGDSDESSSEMDGQESETPFNVFSVGEPTEEVIPWNVSLRNAGTKSRTVELKITAPARNDTLLDRSYSIPKGRFVSGKLREPMYYELQATLEEKQHVMGVGDSFDTCNEHWTTLTITGDGTIESESLHTTIACEDVDVRTPASNGVL